jgi:AbrB family looped-hinge helix DNA binding protein
MLSPFEDHRFPSLPERNTERIEMIITIEKCKENIRRKEIMMRKNANCVISLGQMTIPKEVRKTLDLKPSGKVIIVVDGDRAILKPLRGNILGIGGSIEIPSSEKPVDFRRVRQEVRKKVARKVAQGR